MKNNILSEFKKKSIIPPILRTEFI